MSPNLDIQTWLTAAEYHGLPLLHYDRDFDQIAKVTGQPSAWVARPGSIK